MKRSVIVEGNTYRTALEKGLKKLNVEPGKAKVDVLEEGKTMMGIVLKPYKLMLTVAQNDYDNVDEQADEKSDRNFGLHSADYFNLEYKEDGVNLTIYEFGQDGLEHTSLSMIQHYIKRKKVAGFKNDAIVKAVHNPGQPVKIAEPQPEQPLDEDVIIVVSRDQMKVTAVLLPPEGGKTLTFEDVIQRLRDNGVTHGINEEAIRQLLNNRIYGKEEVIAEGKAPQKGKDAVITYHIDISKVTKPQINEDGTVNYHSLNNIENVKEGQVLATLTPPTDGIPGFTVTGNEIPGMPGKPLALPQGKNTSVSDDGLKLLSSIDGKAELISGKIHVYSIHEVRSNVDTSTGNIDFIGNVIVHGNVLSGFEIRAGGTVEVRGVVEGATIIAQRDVILRKGFQGMRKGVIQAEGNVTARFIENGTVVAKGDVVAETIMHSNVVSGRNVRLIGKKALIVGGKIHAMLGISAHTIGSPMATRTLLEVGLSPEVRDEYDFLKEELAKLEKEQMKVEQILALISRMEATGNLSLDKQLIKQKAIKTKNEYNIRIPEIKARLTELEETMVEVANGKIHGKKIVYPGVFITIGPSSLQINDPVQYATFKREEGEIRFVSYEG